MSSRSRSRRGACGALALLALAAPPGSAGAQAARPRDRVLRVCADPNNLPFSNRAGEGFENRLAELVAREMGARVEYTWWPQRRGFVRNTLNAGTCDVVMGVPAGYEMTATTRPYYRSTYVFVYRARGGTAVRSLDDPALRTARVGVQLIGDDFANTPPAHALARRGIVDNVVGFMIYGDYAEPNPPARIVEAVAAGRVDVALVWGPLAGYFARRQRVPLALSPVTPAAEPPLRYTFAIAMGVRRADAALRRELDAVLERRRAEIERLLDEYGVPRVAASPRSPES